MIVIQILGGAMLLSILILTSLSFIIMSFLLLFLPLYKMGCLFFHNDMAESYSEFGIGRTQVRYNIPVRSCPPAFKHLRDNK